MVEHNALGSRRTTPSYPKPDTLSYKLADSLRAQLHSVNRHLDEVQREFTKSKEELEKGSSVGSPFVQEIQDKPISLNFRLPMLEAYDRGSDPTEHIIALQA
ncbi:hypothetical protein BHE74_00018511 [Ensete ventricosum]|nr:hypothetical protein GW17_00060994 [Ensete ventricosum]RWW73608.1 hypothetical protein BHE74_00018511 [Ensete ventricosum]RZS25534.1 hypothetical protein BHM03_00058746 [Ensete ventricosum]